MTTGVFAPTPILQFTLNNGQLASGGSILTQVGGVNATTYSDSALSVPLPNPIPLNSRGEVSDANGNSQQLFLTPNTVYTFTLSDSKGNQIWQATYVNGIQQVTAAIIDALSIAAPVLNSLERTPAEVAANVTPVNYSYLPGNVLRYGSNTTPGTTDMTAAIQAAITAAGFGNYEVYLPAGTYLISSDISVPVGAAWLQGGSGPFAINIRGDGDKQTIVQFSASGTFARGFYANGNGTIQMGPIISDIQFFGNLVAPTAVTFRQTVRGQLRDCILRNFTGGGAFIDSCLMMRLSRVYFSGCGSSSTACLEIDGSINNSTTVVLDQVYVSSANSGCIAGLRVDRSVNVKISGGAYESCGTPIQIGAKATSGNVTSVTIEDVDLENPGNGNPYIDIGAGLTGGAQVINTRIVCVSGFASGTTSIPYAIRMANTNGILIERTDLIQVGTPTSYIEMVGTVIGGVHVMPHGELAGTVIWPWARYNGAQILSFGCQLDCLLGPRQQLGGRPTCTHKGLSALYAATNLTGSTPSILISATAGGYYGSIGVTNAGATTVSSLSGGEPGMEIILIAADSNTTLAFGNSGGAFRTLSGSNLTMAAAHAYKFINDGANGASGGSCWVQL